MKNSRQWSRLDNAAKIFPSTSTKRDTKVFRFSCELYEPVDADVLQHALDKAIKRFPFYRSILKRGLFWYYLEESRLSPIVKEESAPPCGPLLSGDRKNLLFEVTYYKNRINVEVYHALSDGTGALHFTRTLVFYYLTEKHSDKIEGWPILADYDASEEQKRLDSFYKYYAKKRSAPRAKIEKAYRIRGERFADNRISVIEGRLDAKALLAVARSHGATIGELICTILMLAVRESMSVREESQPVVVTIPVNLRKYYPTETARNFFSIINISHNFSTGGDTFEAVLESVKTSFKELITKDKLGDRMNKLSALEHSMLTKIVPLFIKDPCMRFANWLAKREATTQMSNIGRIVMPAEVASFIKMFSVMSSTDRLQLCLCSYENCFVAGFTSGFTGTDIQRRFFRELTGMGLNVEVVSAPVDGLDQFYRGQETISAKESSSPPNQQHKNDSEAATYS